MTQIFNGEGVATPVTLVEAGPCKVLQVKTKEKDGYNAIQLGFEAIIKKNKLGKKSTKGKEFKYVREFPAEGQFEVGSQINVSAFKEGEKVTVAGISKGKGTQGGVKRWGFSGRNQTRGVKHEHRTLGSVGAARPSEVWPGKKMPGHMGTERITVKNLEIVKIDAEKNIIALKGAVPGPRGTFLDIKSV